MGRDYRSGQYLLNGFYNKLLKVPSIYDHAYSNKLTIRWILAHSGVEGNKVADTLAKGAAQQISSADHVLPAILTRLRLNLKELTHNIAVIKATQKKKLKG